MTDIEWTDTAELVLGKSAAKVLLSRHDAGLWYCTLLYCRPVESRNVFDSGGEVGLQGPIDIVSTTYCGRSAIEAISRLEQWMAATLGHGYGVPTILKERALGP